MPDGLRLYPTAPDTSALQADIAQTKALANEADERAKRAMTKVNATEKTATTAHQIAVDADARTLTLSEQQAALEALANTLGAAIPGSESVHAALQQGIDAATAKANAASSAVTVEAQARAQADTAEAAARKAADDALVARTAALELAVDALQKLKVAVGYGVTNLPASIAAGAVITTTVTLSRNMGSTTYSVGYGLSGGASLLGSLQIVGVTGQTATTVTLSIKNTGVLALLASAASVAVVAARDA